MHEALLNDHPLEGTEVTTPDCAKAMIDEGYYPMTIYFPLVVHGAMLIEPTESESKESLDRFIRVMAGLAEEVKAGQTARFAGAPYFAPRRRLDETRGAETGVALDEGEIAGSGGVRALYSPIKSFKSGTSAGISSVAVFQRMSRSISK
ncbi:MAG TPA: hypothetical protein VMF67_17485 [Rhizomicrobium sp.]|nr:hypothetical protein [Rhizomicrobium sp.]